MPGVSPQLLHFLVFYVGAGGYTSAESESEYIPDNRPMSAPLLDHGTFSLPPKPAYSSVKVETTPVKSQTISKCKLSTGYWQAEVLREG
jgi:hypothetical protein